MRVLYHETLIRTKPIPSVTFGCGCCASQVSECQPEPHTSHHSRCCHLLAAGRGPKVPAGGPTGGVHESGADARGVPQDGREGRAGPGEHVLVCLSVALFPLPPQSLGLLGQLRGQSSKLGVLKVGQYLTVIKGIVRSAINH